MMKNVHIGWGPVGLTKIKMGQTTKLQLNKNNFTGILDSEFSLSIVSEIEETPTWQSSNEAVAIVDQSGNVILVGEGTAVITVVSGKLTGTCYVTVVLSKEQQFEKDLKAGKAVLSSSITKTAVVSNNTVINLNNNNLTGNLFAESGGEMLEGSTDSYAIWVKEGGNITISGDGEVRSQAATYSMAVWAQGGTVTINSGKYYNDGEGSDLIYASAGGKVYIYGGEFHACEKQSGVSGTGNKYSALNIRDKDRDISEIVVYGGKFYNFNPANNLSEGPNTNFVAAGYESVEVEPNVWEVRKIENSLDNTKIYYGTIQNPTFQSFSELTENDILNSETMKTSELTVIEETLTITENTAVVVLIPSTIYTAYKDNGIGGRVKFDDASTGMDFEANGEIKLGDFYVYGEWFWTNAGNLKIYVE